MTILFVLENYYPNIGGVETLFKSLVEQLSANGHQVIVVTTLLYKDDPRIEKIDNITIVRYPFRNRYFFTFLAIFPILKHIRKADLVHTTSYNAGLPAFFVAKLFRKKIIITFHELWGDLWFRLPFMSGFGKRLHHLFEQFLVRLPFDKFVGVSESTVANLRKAGVAEKRLLVNHNGINYDEFEFRKEAPKNKKFTYTFFGRLGVSKGLDLLLQAASRIQEEQADTLLKLIIPKDPKPFFEDILNLIKKNNLENYIQLMHHLSFDDLKAELQASDCVVIPSYSEGFCFAAVETIALGVPLVSSDQQALREVVSGKFIKMKNLSVEALVNAILLAKRGEWSETEIKRFELKDTVERYISLYKELV